MTYVAKELLGTMCYSDMSKEQLEIVSEYEVCINKPRIEELRKEMSLKEIKEVVHNWWFDYEIADETEDKLLTYLESLEEINMNEGIKQYTIEEAYTDNTEIKMYEKGKLVDRKIVSNWKLYAYLERLIDNGYQQAYDVKKYEKAVQEAKESLMQAENELEMARANRLYTEKDLVL